MRMQQQKSEKSTLNKTKVLLKAKA